MNIYLKNFVMLLFFIIIIIIHSPTSICCLKRTIFHAFFLSGRDVYDTEGILISSLIRIV